MLVVFGLLSVVLSLDLLLPHQRASELLYNLRSFVSMEVQFLKEVDQHVFDLTVGGSLLLE